jgi:peptidoglycan/xylan/chitin deacetylase (PgdA/CDA1 family)
VPLRLILAVVALLVPTTTMHAPGTQTNARRIAITIEDVPWTGSDESAQARSAATSRMIEALRAHHAPVAVFVICGRLHADDPLLAQWLATGATIGNHSAHHRDLNTTPLGEWLADVRSCDADLQRITGKRVQFFRFPFLHEGQNDRQRDAAARLLGELHSRDADVTVDNSDVAANQPYSAAVAVGNTSAAHRFVQAALAHDLEATAHFEEVAHDKVGRDIPQILMLHASLMTAELLPNLLDSLERRGYRFVSLETALSDSVFQRPSCYTGSRGLSFLYRIAPCRSHEDAWDHAAEAALLEAMPKAQSH